MMWSCSALLPSIFLSTLSNVHCFRQSMLHIWHTHPSRSHTATRLHSGSYGLPYSLHFFLSEVWSAPADAIERAFFDAPFRGRLSPQRSS
jgi:hypothetical protein